MSSDLFELSIVKTVLTQLHHEKNLISVITGPRQVGKSTAAVQIGGKWPGPLLYFSADDPLPPGPEWVRNAWEAARRKSDQTPLLVLDEVQKVSGWSNAVKSLWDEDRRGKRDLRVLILGSSSLLIQKGLSESLAGRFRLYRMGHWQYLEMKSAFGLSLEQWLYYGGYPGSVPFYRDEETWKSYIRDSLIEPVLSRDVLQMQTVAKPALLRHLFLLSCSYPARILSYNKMLGQLVDAGNTTTLAHYVRLLEAAFLLSGLELFKPGGRGKKASSPKLIVWNNALVNALTVKRFDECRADHEYWGRIVENAAGAALLNELQGLPYEVYYWRKNGDETDFIVQAREAVWAVEIKTARPKRSSGMRRFLELRPDARPFLVGPGGMDTEEFFSTPKRELFRD